jgi:MFS family permease
MYAETMVLPAIPDFIRDFNISYSTSSWILSSYLIAGAVMTPIAGKLSDIYGKKKMLLVILAIYCFGILAAGFANSIAFMLAARIAQGIVVSIFPIAFGIIRDVFPIKKLAVAQSVFSSTFSGGAVVGLLVGAGIIQNYGWHATFFSILPVSAGLIFVISRFIYIKRLPQSDLEETEKNSERKPSLQIDLKGILTLAATIILFLSGLSYLQNSLESAGFVIGLFAGSAVSLALFIFVEKGTDTPLVDLKLITHRTLLPAILILMIAGLATFMVYQTIPVMVRSPQPLGFGGDVLTTANVQLPFMIVLLIGTATSGFSLNKIGNTRLAAIGTIVGTIGFFSLLMFHATEFMVTVTLVVISAGLSLSITGGFNIVLLSVPIRASGIALGMTVLLLMVGQSIGPTVAAMYQQMYQGTVMTSRFPSEQAYSLIFLTAGLISLVSVAFALALYKRKIISVAE